MRRLLTALIVMTAIPATSAVAERYPPDPPPQSTTPGVVVTLDGPLRQHVGSGLRLLVTATDTVPVQARGVFQGGVARRCPNAIFKARLDFNGPGPSTQRVVIRLPPQRLRCMRRFLPRGGQRVAVSAAVTYGGAGDQKNDIKLLR